MLGPSRHTPVLLAETLEWLQPQPGQTWVDGTLGGGGHSRALAERVSPGGRVYSLDRDQVAVDAAAERLAGLPVTPLWSDFRDLPEALRSEKVRVVDGVLLDLGWSSDQLEDVERGFSFWSEGPLDLSYDTVHGEPAWKLINRLSAEHLADLIFEYGEERFSRVIARKVVAAREEGPIRTARQLADIVRSSIPISQQEARLDPATRTFQALRIVVNEEFKSLEIALRRMPTVIRPGGRAAVISFHSLEDRRVKEAFRDDPRYRPLTKKPILPSAVELAANPRARSAKLRVAERTDHEAPTD